jgi:hypothetical protein
MRSVVRTTIIRDKRGYEVRDYGNPTPPPGATLLSAPPTGVHIVGKAGANEMFSISTADNLRLWEKARHLISADDVADFMCRWGQLSRWLTDDGSQPYSEPFLLIEPHLQGLRQLASFVETDDKFGFCRSLKNQLLLARANIAIDINDPGLPVVVEAPSLLRFMLLEMWNEFGGERPAQLGVRSCSYCGKLFQVGGRRGTATRRADARHCSDSCKNMASRARTSPRKERVITRRPSET